MREDVLLFDLLLSYLQLFPLLRAQTLHKFMTIDIYHIIIIIVLQKCRTRINFKRWELVTQDIQCFEKNHFFNVSSISSLLIVIAK